MCVNTFSRIIKVHFPMESMRLSHFRTLMASYYWYLCVTLLWDDISSYLAFSGNENDCRQVFNFKKSFDFTGLWLRYKVYDIQNSLFFKQSKSLTDSLNPPHFVNLDLWYVVYRKTAYKKCTLYSLSDIRPLHNDTSWRCFLICGLVYYESRNF